jgi:hypothetical protein
VACLLVVALQMSKVDEKFKFRYLEDKAFIADLSTLLKLSLLSSLLLSEIDISSLRTDRYYPQRYK